MAIINRQEKWLYLMEPHTASRGTAAALLKLEGCEQFGMHHSSLLDLVNPGNAWASQLESLIGYKIISTVRNPLDVLVTHWWASRNSRREDWLSFEQWIEHCLYTPVVQQPLYRGLWEYANTNCYYETLQEDLNYVLERHVPLEYNEQHKTKHKKHWRTYYTDRLLDLVLRYHQPFLDKFGYYFDGDDMGFDFFVRETRMRPLSQINMAPWRN